MNTQPEALRLADRLTNLPIDFDGDFNKAAAELRRLQCERDELLDACKRALRYSENVAMCEGVYFDEDNDLPVIEAAIAKAEGRPCVPRERWNW